VFELSAIGEHLATQDVSEDGNDNVVGVVLGALDDSVGEEELNSDVLEAVGGEEECNTVPFDDVSDLEFRLVLIALVEHGLSLFHKSEDFNFKSEVVVLNKVLSTFLSSSSLESISGLMRSKTLATHSSCLATALSLSRGDAAIRQTRRAAKMMTFIPTN
jgi:hypothetical protein